MTAKHPCVKMKMVFGEDHSVGEGGLEPPHPFGHRNLNPASANSATRPNDEVTLVDPLEPSRSRSAGPVLATGPNFLESGAVVGESASLLLEVK